MSAVLPMEKDLIRLWQAAVEVRRHAYAPYSRFAVGAALLCLDGSVYVGCNLENAAYSPSLCAERAALAAAIADGKTSFLAIAVAGGGLGEEGLRVCPPCGVCRQTLAEFVDRDFLCLLFDPDGTSERPYRAFPFAQLFPFSFGRETFLSEKECEC